MIKPVSLNTEGDDLYYHSQLLLLETSQVNVMNEVKGQALILYQVSNQWISFSFHINRANNS